ncbi:MAG: ABC transporter permease [Clostridia bacterium]|nr:ABC transporter permease [Clostridia bacterium]
MRKKVLLIALALTLLCAVVAGILQIWLVNIPCELIEYKSTQSWKLSDSTHLAAYMTEEAAFDINKYQKLKVDIADKYKIESIETDNALYSLSRENVLTLESADNRRSASVNATEYVGDYFVFHPIELVEGAYPDRNSVLTDAIVIDELAAWQLFGTQKNIVGLELKLGNDIYIVCGVSKIPDGVYSKVYGEKPRVYINAESAGLRAGALQRYFNTFEAMVPDPITNFAQNIISELLSVYDPVIVDTEARFKGKELDKLRENRVKMITDSSDTEYSYNEKAMLILALKASDVYAVQKVFYYIVLAGIAVIFFTLFTPCVRAVEKLLSKLKF